MPKVTGQIVYNDYTLFLMLPMVQMMPGNPLFLTQRGIGIVTDPRVESHDRVLDLVHSHAGTFTKHLKEVAPIPFNLVGIHVWQGNIMVIPGGAVTFDGTIRRPQTEDFIALDRFHIYIDQEAEKMALEHARHCQGCAEEMGLDASHICKDCEDCQDCNEPQTTIFGHSTIPGEA